MAKKTGNKAKKTGNKAKKTAIKPVITPKKVIYKSFSDKKELKKYLKTISKAAKDQKYELKYRDETGKLKKFRLGKQRKEVIKRIKTYAESHGNERKYMNKTIKRIKKSSMVTFTFNVKKDGQWELIYIRKIHDPKRDVEASQEAFQAILDDVEAAYDIEEYILVSVEIEHL